MLHLLLAAALLAASPVAEPKSCLPPDPADVVVERQTLERKAGPLEAYSVSRLVIYRADCQVVYQQVFGAALETRFRRAQLGDLPILVATVMTPGGSGDGFQHVVLGYDDDGVPSDCSTPTWTASTSVSWARDAVRA